MECDETLLVLARARQLDASISPEAITRFLAEMAEAASQLQQVDMQGASDLPVAFSADWPDDTEQ